MKMHGRKLIHKISIEKKLESKNSIGELTQEWTEFAPAYAEVKPITGREFLSGLATNNSVTHRVIIRYIADMKPNMRVKHKNRYFNIEAVRDFFEKQKWLELMCKEIINE